MVLMVMQPISVCYCIAFIVQKTKRAIKTNAQAFSFVFLIPSFVHLFHLPSILCWIERLQGLVCCNKIALLSKHAAIEMAEFMTLASTTGLQQRITSMKALEVFCYVFFYFRFVVSCVSLAIVSFMCVSISHTGTQECGTLKKTNFCRNQNY